MRARVLAFLLGAAMLAGAGVVLWFNVRGLSTAHAVFVAGLAAFGGLLIDPTHVGQAIAALIGYARAARAVKDATGGESPTPGDQP